MRPVTIATVLLLCVFAGFLAGRVRGDLFVVFCVGWSLGAIFMWWHFAEALLIRNRDEAHRAWLKQHGLDDLEDNK